MWNLAWKICSGLQYCACEREFPNLIITVQTFSVRIFKATSAAESAWIVCKQSLVLRILLQFFCRSVVKSTSAYKCLNKKNSIPALLIHCRGGASLVPRQSVCPANHRL